MKTYVALLRGINIGGRNVLPRKDLSLLLGDVGAQNARTYIQSGNAVFGSEVKDASLLSEEIRGGISHRFGFAPHVLLLTREELEDAMNTNPFPEAESEPKSLHMFFLESTPENPNLEGIESIRGERFALEGKVFYLHAPDGIGRSKLAARVEKLLGVPATARNWRTVCKVMEMAEGI